MKRWYRVSYEIEADEYGSSPGFGRTEKSLSVSQGVPGTWHYFVPDDATVTPVLVTGDRVNHVASAIHYGSILCIDGDVAWVKWDTGSRTITPLINLEHNATVV